MDKLISDLLFNIPDGVDYAASSTELDSDDIPQSRVEALKLLLDSEDSEICFNAAIVLTSWGYKDGLNKLESVINNNYRVFMVHRLYSYDDSLLHVLKAVKRYWAVQTDMGNENDARQDVYPVISLIIIKSSTEKFDISILYPWLERQMYLEYIPLLKEHLEAIIDNRDFHEWKICDVISCLMKLAPDYVDDLLKKKGKPLDYYCK